MYEEILLKLEEEIINCEIDYYNDSTFNWSKGYKKGLIKALEIIKNNE